MVTNFFRVGGAEKRAGFMQINMFDLVRGFSSVVDLVNTTLASHHQRVAYIAGTLCRSLNLEQKTINKVVLAAELHDLGVIPLHVQIDGLMFEKNTFEHSVAGQLLLSTCSLMTDISRVIRYHHASYQDLPSLSEEDQRAAEDGNIIHLADTIDMSSRSPAGIERLRHVLKTGAGTVFPGSTVEAAMDLIKSPDFFHTLEEASGGLVLPPSPELMLSAEEVTEFSLLFAHIIDARSPFTATHSSGVANLSVLLHELTGLPQGDRQTMFVAGLLHDIGKMGVPLEFLEKQGPLTKEEFAAVSRHAALSQEVLGGILGFERIAPWGAWHHERLNGSGYPNGHHGDKITLESRLTAVADVLTALTEDRPYRAGMTNEGAFKILDKMVADGALDGEVVALARLHMEDIGEARREAQNLASEFFKSLQLEIKKAIDCAK
jgi:HD-GYP domain-containing protein (c-di-GMP phosphodiesterase class II)